LHLNTRELSFEAMTPFANQRILFVRLDRIGDLVLTLPVDSAVRGADVDWWIPEHLGFVAMLAQPPRKAREVPRKISISRFFDLVREVREVDYDAAVVFHAPWWVSLLLACARIPIRGGVRSQWHSFLFLNRTVRQKRSQAEFSELEYSYQLVEKIFGLERTKRHSLKLHGVDAAARASLLSKIRLEDRGYFVVHPGMGGSALNWPTENYATLIRELAKDSPVVITGTESDEPYLAPLRKLLGDESGVFWLDGRLGGPELITILDGARAIVAPSTGVLHLAASTGRPTLGLFSPVRVQHPKRWGPQGDRVVTLLPDVVCPGELRCLGPVCPHYDCMTLITPEQVLVQARLLEEHLEILN
jgi:heptosyltransferase I